jgi:hypothetical protein
MLPYLDPISETILTMVQYCEYNVRFECISALNGITMGLNKLECGEDFEWLPGFNNMTPIGEKTEIFLKQIYFPALAIVFESEDEDEVVERMMQSLIEVSDELGPAVYDNRIEQLLKLVNNLLEQKNADNTPQEGEGDFEDMGEDDGEEDIDHNETVLANATELISSISRALGEDFAEYFERTGELLFMHLQDHYPMRDKSLCIGTMSE